MDGSAARGNAVDTSRSPGSRRQAVLVVALVAATAILSRLPALDAWWCLDDWGQLGRAAGLTAREDGMPARWLSQHVWWTLTWPLFGASAVAHAWARILIHASAAATVAVIVRRAGMTTLQQLLAGALFAATPIAFTPLYWASGIQELLAGLLALLAVERWFAAGARGTLLAGILGAAAILAKESPLGLPLFFGCWIVATRRGSQARRSAAWLVPALLTIVALGEAVLVSRHFETGPNARYATGGALVWLGNLGKFGWWLPTPGPVFTAQVDWPRAIAGLALWTAWGIGGWILWRRGRKLVLASWFGALLSLVPVLPLLHQANPYLGYLAAAAGVIALVSLLPRRLGTGSAIPAMLVIVGAVLWGQLGMRSRLGVIESDGHPADPVVRATAASRTAADALLAAAPGGFTGDEVAVVIYQPALRETSATTQVRAPQDVALAGAVGVGIVLGVGDRAEWVTSLLTVPDGARILCLKGEGFQDWGGTHDALIHAATLHLAAGQFPTVHSLLARAADLGPTLPMRASGPDVLGIRAALIAPRVLEFDEWLVRQETAGELEAADAARCRRFRPGL